MSPTEPWRESGAVSRRRYRGFVVTDYGGSAVTGSFGETDSERSRPRVKREWTAFSWPVIESRSGATPMHPRRSGVTAGADLTYWIRVGRSAYCR
jgi:hypothetical protein